MGGRGGSSGIVSLSPKQERKLEDVAQKNDAKFAGWRNRAKFYEYTDSEGKVHRGETGANTQGGTYRAKYSEQVADYAKMSTSFLEKEKERLKAVSDNHYQKSTRVAASRTGTHMESFADADTKLRMINQVLRRRKKK